MEEWVNEKSFFNNRVWITWISKRNRLAYIEFLKIAIGASKGNTSIVWTCSQSIPCVRKSRNTMKEVFEYGLYEIRFKR